VWKNRPSFLVSKRGFFCKSFVKKRKNKAKNPGNVEKHVAWEIVVKYGRLWGIVGRDYLLMFYGYTRWGIISVILVNLYPMRCKKD
jgi:hypothetical protein